MSKDLWFSIIAAVDQNRGIGKGGRLPWSLPGDLRHFKELTTARSPGKKHVVMMGRKTWDSLPGRFKPLPHRINIVLSRQQSLSLPQEVYVFPGFDQAWEEMTQGHLAKDIESVFVIGGAEIFQAAFLHPQCQRIYLTQIQASLACDTFMPDWNRQFTVVHTSPLFQENGLTYYFAEYHRKPSG